MVGSTQLRRAILAALILIASTIFWSVIEPMSAPSAASLTALAADPVPASALLIGPDRLPQVCRFVTDLSEPACHTVGLSVAKSLEGALGDLDGDGRLDAVLVLKDQAMACPVDSESSSECFALTDKRGGVMNVDRVELADVDLDGHLDLVILMDALPMDRPAWCKGDGSPQFDCQPLDNQENGGKDIAVGDVDADGDLDVAVAGSWHDGSAATICQNLGGGSFDCRRLVAAGGSVSRLGFAQIDGDGRMDLWLAFEFGRGHGVCLARESGFDCHPIVLEAVAAPTEDLDLAFLPSPDDGPADLLLAGWPARRCRQVGLNERGELRYDCSQHLLDGQGARALLPLDLDGDGQQALLAGGPNRLCRQDARAEFRCEPIGDPEAMSRQIELPVIVPTAAPSPSPSVSPSPTGATPTGTVTPATRPTTGPTWTAEPSATPSPTRPTPTAWGLPATGSATPQPVELRAVPDANAALRLQERGRLSLPSTVRHLRQEGERALAFGSECRGEAPTACESHALLIDLQDPDRPRDLGRLILPAPDANILDGLIDGAVVYLIVERGTGAAPDALRRDLVSYDARDPSRPAPIDVKGLGPPPGQGYPLPAHAGLFRIGPALIWATSSSLRYYDISHPLQPQLVQQVALGASSAGQLGPSLLLSEPGGQRLRLLDATDASRLESRGVAGISLGGRAMSGLPEIHITGDRAYAEALLTCGDVTPPEPWMGPAERACGSALTEVMIDARTLSPRQAWFGLLSTDHGLGAVRRLGDWLLIGQEHLKIMDARSDPPTYLGELKMERLVDGVLRPAYPYDILVHDGRAVFLTRVDDRQPAELVVAALSRRWNLHLPYVAVAAP